MIVKTRQHLADALYRTLPQLERAYAANGTQERVAIVLQRAIVAHCDEETLGEILADVQAELEGTPHTPMPLRTEW